MAVTFDLKDKATVAILLAEFYCQEHGGAYNATFRDEMRSSVARAIEALTNSQKNTEKLL